MNILGGIIVLVLCVYIGYEFSQKYVKRKKYYTEFNLFNQVLISDVAFSKSTITKLIEKNKDKKDDFSINAKQFFIDKKDTINSNILSNEEKEELLNYFQGIGGSDSKTQLKYLESYCDKLKSKVEESSLDEKKYKSFYVKLGFLFGLIMFIILL